MKEQLNKTYKQLTLKEDKIYLVESANLKEGTEKTITQCLYRKNKLTPINKEDTLPEEPINVYEIDFGY